MVNDFNIHLYTKDKSNIEDQIVEDTELRPEDLIRNILRYEEHFKNSGVLQANFHLFNSYVFDFEGFDNFTSIVNEEFPGSTLTLLYDFKNTDTARYLKAVKSGGFSFIKFHCYVQNITMKDFDKIVEISIEAEKLGLGICIDASYGTNKIYTNDNLALAAQILNKVNITPVILLHSGGPRIFETMLLALQNKNVYLETSLSLDFYEGSRIWEDYAYAYKRIGLERILFASDFPYQPVDEALKTFSRFVECLKCTKEEQEMIKVNNFLELKKLVCNT